jgi:hypothetical protein
VASKRSYAVVWSNNGATRCGRLELLRDRFELHGRERPFSIPYAELTSASIARGDRDRLRGLPVLVLGRRGSAPVRIASLEGAGALHELAARVGRGALPSTANQSGT